MKSMQANGNAPISLDFNAIASLDIGGRHYIEYVYHKFFSGSDRKFDERLSDYATWDFPECWKARYYLYYVLCKHALQDSKVLDLGSNFNFYSVWALENGAKYCTAVEGDINRFPIGTEYASIKRASDRMSFRNQSVMEYLSGEVVEKHEVVFLLDLAYYLDNLVEVLDLLDKKVQPKFIFLESTVVNDYCDTGHFELWTPSTDSKAFESYHSNDTKRSLAMIPSRNALRNVVLDAGWQVECYYNYHDFLGRGESPPRRDGRKDFYLLKK